MLYDVLRFNASARRLVGRWNTNTNDNGAVDVDVDVVELSIGEYLRREGYSESFRDNYLIVRGGGLFFFLRVVSKSSHTHTHTQPMTAAIWSTPPDKCALDFPAQTLIQFMHNHHLLQITGKPDWLTIPGGRYVDVGLLSFVFLSQGVRGVLMNLICFFSLYSHQYVNKILSTLPSSQLHLSTPISSIRPLDSPSQSQSPSHQGGVGIELTTTSGQTSIYDHIILATHSNTALSILRAGGSATKEEEEILGMFEWNRNNRVVVHDDVRLMPKRRDAWSCWNYLMCEEGDGEEEGEGDGDGDGRGRRRRGVSGDRVSL